MKLTTFIPHRLPLGSLDWEAVVGLAGKAHAVLARYDEMLKSVRCPASVFSLLTTAEAIDSMHSQKLSRSLEEVYLHEAGEASPDESYDRGTSRILNYRHAVENSAKWVVKHPISLAFICKIHGDIGHNAKGNKKEIGRFRKRQNWIGPEGCSIKEAYFYPPRVSILNDYLHNLKQYLSYKENDPLVQLAIFFAQLLIIHPFMDGNGRVARILISLFLYKKGLISLPMVYLSTYFKKHRLNYFEKLYLITSKNAWEDWIVFFLRGIIDAGEQQLTQGKEIVSLYQQFLELVGHSHQAQKTIDMLFAQPILEREIWVRQKRAFRALKILEKEKLVVPYKRKPMVVVKELLAIGHRDKI